jgi:hypothetical protein
LEKFVVKGFKRRRRYDRPNWINAGYSMSISRIKYLPSTRALIGSVSSSSKVFSKTPFISRRREKWCTNQKKASSDLSCRGVGRSLLEIGGRPGTSTGKSASLNEIGISETSFGMDNMRESREAFEVKKTYVGMQSLAVTSNIAEQKKSVMKAETGEPESRRDLRPFLPILSISP